MNLLRLGLFASLLILLTITMTNSEPLPKQITQQIAERCPECVYISDRGEMQSKDGTVPVTFVLVQDFGTDLRVERAELDGKSYVILYFPKGVINWKLKQFFKMYSKR